MNQGPFEISFEEGMRDTKKNENCSKSILAVDNVETLFLKQQSRSIMAGVAAKTWREIWIRPEVRPNPPPSVIAPVSPREPTHPSVREP